MWFFLYLKFCFAGSGNGQTLLVKPGFDIVEWISKAFPTEVVQSVPCMLLKNLALLKMCPSTMDQKVQKNDNLSSCVCERAVTVQHCLMPRQGRSYLFICFVSYEANAPESIRCLCNWGMGCMTWFIQPDMSKMSAGSQQHRHFLWLK